MSGMVGDVVGALVGETDGASVGDVVGALVGETDGASVDGELVGAKLGAPVDGIINRFEINCGISHCPVT